MSNTKSVEQQLKEAIEASKQTLALSEQVTSLASEKEALSKRLAEIETALTAPKAQEPVAVDPLIVAKLGELLAEREMTAKVMKEMQANLVRLEKEAAKKADLNEYVQQRLEEGKDGNTPAEKQHLDAGKKGKKGEMPQFIKDKIEEREEEEKAESCGPKGKKGKVEIEIEESEEESEEEAPAARKAKKASKAGMPDFIKEKIKEKEEAEAEEEEEVLPHSSKAKKAGKAYDDEEDYGDLSEEEMDMIRQHRYGKKHAKKADSTLKAPLKEEKKDFGDIIPQPGLDPNKNTIDEDNTTSPTLGKKAAKATKKGETDVEEIMESPDRQKEEGEDHKHEVTLSEPAPGAKKGKKAEEADLSPEAKKAGEDEIPAPLMDYIKELIKKEKSKKGENSLPGINKQDVVGQPDQDEEESHLNKKGGKKAESIEKCVKDNCASDETKVHEDGCAPTKGNTTDIGDTQPLAKNTLDSVVDVAVSRLAEVAKAKKQVEAELAKQGETLAHEVKAKSEAMAAVAQLQAKFEALMNKVAQVEASDKTLEAKAAKLMAATASEPVSAEISGEAPKTDADILAQFESITDSREKNKFFKAHAAVITRAAQTNLRRRS
jgi:hypothetical protein